MGWFCFHSFHILKSIYILPLPNFKYLLQSREKLVILVPMAKRTLGEDRAGRQAQRSRRQVPKPDGLGLRPVLSPSGDQHNLNILSAKFLLQNEAPVYCHAAPRPMREEVSTFRPRGMYVASAH